MGDNETANIKDIDYSKECEVLRYENQQLRRELEDYKQALLNICIKI